MQTLDAMTGGGRVMLGLGSTRPRFAKGLHGRPWGKPVARMRDYMAIVRAAFESGSLAHQGREISIPYAGEGSFGSPALTLLLEPTPDIPISVAASGTQMISLAAEIADGWLPRSFPPGMLEHALPLLEAGFERAGGGKSIHDFEIWAHADDDVAAAMQPIKENVAQWAGPQRRLMEWCGWAQAYDRIEELKAAGRWAEAVAAVPEDCVDQAWLVGPLSRVRRKGEPWLESGATGLILRYGPQVGVDHPPENLDFYRTVTDVAR
jgi:alkanesulfonate monooxygenase SsuD/methylene tetrahydromethanopterin reductase-like flavin-dependent oxidoreductase (luciferase family)